MNLLTTIALLTPSQAEMVRHGVNMGLCFQPLIQPFNFKKGIIKNEEGKFMFDNKTGKAIMEKDIAAALKEQVINDFKIEYGDNWKHAFQHPKLYTKLA